MTKKTNSITSVNGRKVLSDENKWCEHLNRLIYARDITHDCICTLKKFRLPGVECMATSKQK